MSETASPTGRDPKLLLQHARWCRISARNSEDGERARNLRLWARRLEEMAAALDADSDAPASGKVVALRAQG